MFRHNSIGLAAAGALILAVSGSAAVPGGRAFPSPNAAAQALVNAAKTNNVKVLIEILGPSSKDIVLTRDPVADARVRREFAARAAQKMRLVQYPGRQNERILLAGSDGWPLPIPIVRLNGKWYFDTARGREEVLNRRIGSNELDAIEVARGYVEAQDDHGDRHRTSDGLPVYAQRVFSTPGQRDGLYWAGEPGIEDSPIGKIIAQAFAEGYTKPGEPFHGYYFKVLSGQGPHTSGGEMSYLDGGKMTKGFAMVAWPSDYGSTGIMTFLVDKTGIVYEKDLGRDTGKIAAAFTAYDPDTTWKPVSEPTQP
jgi:hypothetical protein